VQLLIRYGHKRQEHFIVITLDGNHHAIRQRAVTIGLVNRTIVHPREIFYPAIVDNASAIVVAHNHPSGALVPSEEDKEVTEVLVKAGEVLGIPVLDHIIIGASDYLSMEAAGYMKPSKMAECALIENGEAAG
jgi:DNA repair protein RadC